VSRFGQDYGSNSVRDAERFERERAMDEGDYEDYERPRHGGEV
jgi:hypothetical protein